MNTIPVSVTFHFLSSKGIVILHFSIFLFVLLLQISLGGTETVPF